MNLTDKGVRSRKDLRKFGVAMFSAFFAVSLILAFRGKSAWPFTAGTSVAFLTFALLLPGLLAPIERYWMMFAGVLGHIMTGILLTLVFFIGVLPTGLLMRMFGKDPLAKSFDKSLDSYWIDVRPEGPGSRPGKPY